MLEEKPRSKVTNQGGGLGNPGLPLDQQSPLAINMRKPIVFPLFHVLSPGSAGIPAKYVMVPNDGPGPRPNHINFQVAHLRHSTDDAIQVFGKTFSILPLGW